MPAPVVSRPRARSRSRAAGAVTACAALALLGAGCTGSEEDGAAPVDRGTPLAEVDTSSLVVARAPWCEDLPAAAVERALGGPVARTSSYTNGDRARITDQVRDVAHEHSCTFRAADGTTARAWVFAPPVTPAAARALARSAGRSKGCRVLADAPALGRPSVATLCSGGTEVAYHGLLGDAWLSCSLAAPAGVREADLRDRTDQWCTAVVQTAAGG